MPRNWWCWCISCKHTHTHMHAHTDACKRTHVRTHTRMHAHTHTHTLVWDSANQELFTFFKFASLEFAVGLCSGTPFLSLSLSVRHPSSLSFKLVKTENPSLLLCILICRVTNPSPVMHVPVVCVWRVHVCARTCIWLGGGGMKWVYPYVFVSIFMRWGTINNLLSIMIKIAVIGN